MWIFILSILLVMVLLYAIILLKTYRHISAKELKREARSGDKLASSLYRVTGFGYSLDIFLWFVIGVSGGLLFALLSSHINFWISAVLISLMIWLGFAWLPKSHGSYTGRLIARYSAKPLQIIIDFLYPLLSRIERQIMKFTPISLHTGLYERQDLLDLLSQQKGQLDNRIPKEDLMIAQNALRFGEKIISEIMTPKRVIKFVNIEEQVGPVLMEELHKSGHSRFPVYEGKKDNFVGILYLRDVIKAKAGGSVRSLMVNKIYYVHDESSVSDVLQAFIKTHYHMFLVVNNFEEVVGLVTMEEVIEQIIGKPILDEFDDYESPRAVATRLASQEHKANNEAVDTTDNKSSKSK